MNTKYGRELLSELHAENQRLSHALATAQAKLSAAEQRADVSVQSAQRAWEFAKLALRTGRSG